MRLFIYLTAFLFGQNLVWRLFEILLFTFFLGLFSPLGLVYIGFLCLEGTCYGCTLQQPSQSKSAFNAHHYYICHIPPINLIIYLG